MIQDKKTKTIRPLVFNLFQTKVLKSWFKQAGAGRPIKTAVPKSRKGGVSTLCEAFGWFLANERDNWSSLTVAHQSDATNVIFGYAHRIHAHIHGSKRKNLTTKRELRFDNKSRYRCMTAMGNYGASGSDNYWIHVSEAALMENKSSQDAEQIAALINSMPQGEAGIDTGLVLESTGNGPFGTFAKICMESAKEGSQSEFDVVFLSWLEDPDLTDPEWESSTGNIGPLTTYEEWLVKECGAKPAQISWRRKHIATHHPEWVGKDGNPPIFGYHYPAVLTECFSAVTGAIYPNFSTRNRQKVDISGQGWERYRAIDWGWQGQHAFVCLKIAHNPSSPPMLTMDPEKCPNLCDQMVGYCVSDKTGQPLKENDDTCDALRYVIVSLKLRGHVHVYGELYILGAASIGPTGVARRVHEFSGWSLPEGANEMDISLYRPPAESTEIFGCTVADRSQSGLINQFCMWGIPTIPHDKPEAKDNSRGEVWDGIGEVSALISGDATFSAVGPDADKAKLIAAYRKVHRRRPVMLPDAECKLIREDTYGEKRQLVHSHLGEFYLSD